MRRRAALLAACSLAAPPCSLPALAQPIAPRPLRFPRDFGAHPELLEAWRAGTAAGGRDGTVS